MLFHQSLMVSRQLHKIVEFCENLQTKPSILTVSCGQDSKALLDGEHSLRPVRLQLSLIWSAL